MIFKLYSPVIPAFCISMLCSAVAQAIPPTDFSDVLLQSKLDQPLPLNNIAVAHPITETKEMTSSAPTEKTIAVYYPPKPQVKPVAAEKNPHHKIALAEVKPLTTFKPLQTIPAPQVSKSLKEVVAMNEVSEVKPTQKVPVTDNATSNDESGQNWNLQDVDLRKFIQHVASMTGKDFIIDPRVQGKVTIVSQSTLSPDELYQVFLSTLQVHGYALVNSGKVSKIIPTSDAKSISTDNNSTGVTTSEDFIVKVINVENVPARDLVLALKPLTDKNSHLAFYNPSNNLIIGDRRANIARIEDIVRRLDRPTNHQVEVVHLRHASAAELVELLANLEKNNNEQQPDMNVRFAADTRSNAVLISGGTGNRLRYRALIAEMDVMTNNAGNVQVIYLKFVRARDLAPIIANVITAYETQLSGKSDPSTQTSSSTTAPAQNSTPSVSQTTQRNSSMGGANYSNNNSNSSSGSRLNQQVNYGSLEDQPKSGSASGAVQWEETTNALIIKAPPSIMESVRQVIAKLDIRRPQVLVETIIAEIQVDRTRDLGIEWNSSGDVRFGSRFPTTNGSSLGLGTALGTVTPDFTAGSGLTIGYFKHDNLRVLLRALSSDTTTNILSTPNIVTLDNETATIKVGQLVPFATGRSTDSLNTGGTPFTSFTREEVGLTLTIRPQITQSGAIKMQIDHVLSNVIPGSVDTTGANNPTTAERVIQTNVMVDDGEVLVLGGLIRDDWTKGNTRIPVFGDLPVVGSLFGSQGKIHSKRNLMIFLRPVIMRDKDTATFVTGGKYNDIRQKQLSGPDENRAGFPAEPVVLARLGGEPVLPPPLRNLGE